jgi:hypothetical protein
MRRFCNGQRPDNEGHRPAKAGAKSATDHGPMTTENRKPKSKKWRSIASWRVRWRLEAPGVHERKVWQLGALRSTGRRLRAQRNGALTLRKAPIPATFRRFFDDFLRVFS